MKKPFKFTKHIDVPLETKPVKKGHLKFKLTIFLALLIWSLIAVWGVWDFFNQYGLQSPLILRSPIYSKKANIIISPVGTGSATLKSYIFDVGKIADKIYTLESSNGRNDSCKNLGLVNGYGWRQSTFEWKCYATHEEVRSQVIDWLTRHIKNGDVETALCLYNRGVEEKGCKYAVNYLSLK